MTELDLALAGQLTTGRSWWLRDLSSGASFPRTTGIYTLWQAARFLYVGISKQDPNDPECTNRRAAGLFGRLQAYRCGVPTETFCWHVSLRELSEAQRLSIVDRDTARVLIKAWNHANVTVRVASCDQDTAERFERDVKRGGLPGVGLPEYNPAPILRQEAHAARRRQIHLDL